MKKNWLKLTFIFLLVGLMLTACGKSKDTTSTDSADKKEFNIVTSFYPMYVFTKNIVGNTPGVKVENMTEPQTGCLHDYQLSPSDLKTLGTADAFIINGAGMEAFMEKVVGQMPELHVIEASKGIELIKNQTDGEENAHVWVSISNAIKEVENIALELAKVNPENKEAYNKNAAEYINKLEEQRTRMHKDLDGIRNKTIITFHEAFPYFAKEFGLNVVAVIEREPGSQPSAGELADTIKIIRDTGVKALFAEPQYSLKAAETIANQTGVKIYTLDPIVTGPKDADPGAYIKTMDENLKSLIEALK